MPRALVALLVLWPTLLPAKVLNVELKFTPFRGDPKDDHVQAVAGTARVYVNNVPVAEQPVEAHEVPVLFEEREIAPSVWMPLASMGPAVRKGRNVIRIEFEPTDATKPYRARLAWATVTDQVKEEKGEGTYKGTNQADAGVEDKEATGKVVVEHEVVAEFVKDLAWHHYPAVTGVTDEDRQHLAALLKTRADWFKPDFAPLYKALAGREDFHVDEVRKHKCLDAAYKAGVRIAPPPADEVEVVTTGNPEVVLQRKGKDAMLFTPVDPQAFGRIKGDDVQMCAGMTLAMVYPPRLSAVRTPAGTWEIVY
jgi:hypothetical protein